MARTHRLAAAIAIPLIGMVSASSVGFADRPAIDGSASGGGEAAAPPTTALPALPPLPGTTPPAPAPPVTSPPVAPPTVPVVPTVPVPTAPVAPPTVPVVPTVPVATGPAAATPGYAVTLDVTGLLTVELPVSWADIDDRRVIANDGTLRPGIWASTDLDGFRETFETAGVIIEAYPYSADLRPVAAERFGFIPQACTDGGEIPYADGVFTGTLHTWNYCDGGATRNFVLTASPATMDMTILIYAQTVTPDDEVFVNHILGTFNVVPGIGLPTETVPPPTSAPATVAPAPATVAPVPAPATVAPVTVAPPAPPATVPPVPTGPPVGG